jgi:hypothetical protein
LFIKDDNLLREYPFHGPKGPFFHRGRYAALVFSGRFAALRFLRSLRASALRGGLRHKEGFSFSSLPQA